MMVAVAKRITPRLHQETSIQTSWLDTTDTPREIPALPRFIKIEHRSSLPEPRRASVKPLSEAREIYDVLAALAIGAMIPTNVRINDTKSGTIPPWMLWERKVDEIVQLLTIVDVSTFHDHIDTETGEVTLRVVACEVFTAPSKTLDTQMFMWHVGCGRRRNKLADMGQHAKQCVERDEFDEDEEEI